MYFTTVRTYNNIIFNNTVGVSVESTEKNIHLLCGRERHYKNNPSKDPNSSDVLR